MVIRRPVEIETKVLWVKTTDGKKVLPVLVDGDYDGEYFETLVPYMRILKSGYVNIFYYKYLDTPRYLQHMVLPQKKGYWITFKNGNKQDCRSANLEYMTPKQATDKRNAKFPEIYLTGTQWGGLKHRKRNPNAKTTTPYRGVRYSGDDKNPVYWGYCKKIYLGAYENAEDCARQYDRVAHSIWGDAAVLNFPEEYKK